MCVQDVANAVGAALGTVGGISDIVVNLGPIKEALKGSCDPPDVVELEHKSREVALRRARDTATDEVINKIKKGSAVFVEDYPLKILLAVMCMSTHVVL